MSDVSLRLDSLIPGLADMKDDLRLKVGVLEGATNQEGESVAFYAAKNEFGTKDIPARPAMRTTLLAHGEDYLQALAWMLQTGSDPEQALRELGELVRGNMVEKIASWTEPPNSEAYVKWKLKNYNVGNKPLYLTGAYAGSIAYEVVKDGGDE